MVAIIALLLITIGVILAVELTDKKDSEKPDDPIVYEVPSPPTQLARDDTLTNQTQVAFTWLAPDNDGGLDILDYAIEMYESEY